MRKIFIAMVVLVASATTVMAQGIVFHDIAFDEALKLAEKEGKMVFVDLYTEWCGPCKTLSKRVFPDKSLGSFFNEKYISIKIDAEKEGVDVAKKYKVHAYPTLLFLSSKGELVNKSVGLVEVEKLLLAAKKTFSLINDPDNLANLEKRYESEKNNEEFLIKYIDRQIEMRENPSANIELFLSYQKMIKHNQFEMLDFILKYKDYIACGSTADKIFRENKKELLDIATKHEEKMLNIFFVQMARRGRLVAFDTRDADMYKSFITAFESFKESDKSVSDDIALYNVELLSMTATPKEFKPKAAAYLDSLIGSMTVSEVKIADDDFYNKIAAQYGDRDDYYAVMNKSAAEKMYSRVYTSNIFRVSGRYLEVAKSKKDFKEFNKWVEYGIKLMPKEPLMRNLKANYLYLSGKKKEAIALKGEILASLNDNHRDYKKIASDLELMKQGKFTIK